MIGLRRVVEEWGRCAQIVPTLEHDDVLEGGWPYDGNLVLDPAGLYDSARLAAGYAFARPPVHPRIIERIRARLGIHTPVGRALDIGCGAGLSTAALQPLARVVVGLEPSRVMLRHRGSVAPAAAFVNGRAEELPFRHGSFPLVSAAGTLDYVDLQRFLPAVRDVMTPDGVLVVYDFSSGRRSRERTRLPDWFDAFERRYPFPQGYGLDVRQLDFGAAGLRLAGHEAFETGVTVTSEGYLDYVMTESNVERAVADGAGEEEIRGWCRESLRKVFAGTALEILFDGYIAWVERS